MKKYTCIFPALYNYHLTKDVGMIPYTLSDKYETSIVTYQNDDYIYMDDELKKDNFNLEFIRKSSDIEVDVLRYLKANSKNIDVLQIYHLNYNALLRYVLTYKRRNKDGKIYLKLDANNEIIDFLIKREGFLPSLRRLYAKIIFKKIDIISIETKRNYQLLKDFIGEEKLIYIPNGIAKSNIIMDNKKKYILYVGYIEKKNKSTDMLINAFIKTGNSDWKLILIGEVKEDMKEYLNILFNKNPQLKNQIILKGYISDKKLLNAEYAKSSIYCCSSQSESFGISTLEAAYFGNYIISTPVGASRDIIEKTAYGTIIEHDENALKNELEKTMLNWENTVEDPYNIQKKIFENFNWKLICNKIIEKIEE